MSCKASKPNPANLLKLVNKCNYNCLYRNFCKKSDFCFAICICYDYPTSQYYQLIILYSHTSRARKWVWCDFT